MNTRFYNKMKSGLFTALMVVSALGLMFSAVPANAFGGGFGGAVDAATTAAVAGYGAQIAVSASDDDDDD